MILLSDEEMWDCDTPCIKGDCPHGVGDKPSWQDRDDSVCVLCEHRVIAQAQLKKVDRNMWHRDIDWNVAGQKPFKRRIVFIPEDEWQALLKEVK